MTKRRNTRLFISESDRYIVSLFESEATGFDFFKDVVYVSVHYVHRVRGFFLTVSVTILVCIYGC